MYERSLYYRSFLLRIWKQDGEWHATLMEVSSGVCEHFATLKELYAKLCEVTSENESERA